MILDAETTFFDQAAHNATSDIINLGLGDAGRGEPLYVFVAVKDGTAASGMVVTLNTSENDDMTSPAAIATRTVPAADVTRGGLVFKAVLPTGCKKYVQMAITGLTAGTVTAGINLGGDDVPLICDWRA